MTNAEARFNKSLRPRKPEGSLGRRAQDVHLDSHTAPELWTLRFVRSFCFCLMSSDAKSILGTIYKVSLFGYIIVKTMGETGGGGGGGGSEVSLVHLRINIWIGT